MANAFWEEVKKIFKTKQTLSEEEAQAVTDAVGKESKLVDALKQLEADYMASVKKEDTDVESLFPESLNLETINYTTKTDQEIAKQAETELQEDYFKSLNDIDAEAFEKAAELQEKSNATAEEKTASLKEIEDLYASLKSSAEKDALKRGLARSSIITERLNNYDISKAQSAAEIKTSYDKSIAEINDEIDSLNTEKEKSLEELDLSYASDLTERIEKLNAERDKLTAAAVTANNKIAKQEAEYKAERAENIADYEAEKAKTEAKAAEELAEYESENGYSGAKQENFSQRYNLALDFYMSLDADVAPKALEASSNMKYYLGNYYSKLLSALNERADNTTNRYSN